MVAKSSLQFIAYFMRAFPGRSLLTVGFLTVAGLFEGIGVISLLPLLELAMGGSSNSALSQTVTKALQGVGLEPNLAILLGIIMLGLGLKGFFLWLGMRQVGYTVAHVTTELRLKLIRALLKANWSYFVSQPAGHFANAISSEALRAGVAYSQACRLIAGLIQLVIYLSIVFLTSWQLALLALVAGGIVLSVLNFLVRLGRRAGQDQTSLLKSLLARLTDALYGIKPIKAMAREHHFGRLLETETQGLNTALQRQIVAVETLRAFQEPLVAFMLLLGLYGALTYSGWPFSTLLVMAFLFYRAMTYLGQTQTYYQGMALGESAFWSLLDGIKQADDALEVVGGTTAPPALKKEVQLSGVGFAYGNKAVLKDVSLVIPAGQFTALVGPSGVGKTTLVDLIIGLYQPQTGEISLDGTPLNDVNLRGWRDQIGYVPQEMFLFHDSVYHNVALGDETITRQAVEEALRAAGAWEFIKTLPEGLDTNLGERGARLSGGQRQRVAIARALVRKPTLLILDEVTTSLDPDTEVEICKTLKALSGAVTVVAISHQAAMMDVADVVIELGKDKIDPVANRVATESRGTGLSV